MHSKRQYLKKLVLLHRVPVGSMPCSSAMTSQNLAPIWFPHWPRKRETCICIRIPQHVRIWLENTWGMSEKGTRVHNTAPRRETKRLSYRAYNPISDIWPPWTCTSSRMAAGEVESERQRFWGCLRATGRWQLPRNFNMTSIAGPNKQNFKIWITLTLLSVIQTIIVNKNVVYIDKLM